MTVSAPLALFRTSSTPRRRSVRRRGTVVEVAA